MVTNSERLQMKEEWCSIGSSQKDVTTWDRTIMPIVFIIMAITITTFIELLLYPMYSAKTLYITSLWKPFHLR